MNDIVEGTLLAAGKISDATAISLGTMERVRVIDAAQEILERTGYKAEIVTDTTKPTGPYNRVADNNLAQELLGWAPQTTFSDGLQPTIDWYFKSHQRKDIQLTLDRRLMEH